MKINPHELTLENVHQLAQEFINETKKPSWIKSCFEVDGSTRSQLRWAHELLEWRPNTFSAHDGWNMLLSDMKGSIISTGCFNGRLSLNSYGIKIFNFFKESFNITYPVYDTKYYQKKC